VTPSFEVIFEGKRVSLVEGTDATGLVAAVRASFAALGFAPTPPAVRDCVFSTALPLGWRRSVVDNVVTVVKAGGQAEELAVGVGDKVLKVDGASVQTDAQFEAAVQAAKAQGRGVVTVTLQSAASLKGKGGSLAAQAAAAYVAAKADATSGAFSTRPGGPRNGSQEPNKVERFTSDFLPGNQQLNDAAERLTKGIEDLFTREAGESEEEDKKKRKKGKGKGPK
jgi:membrane-associated protease RseP (regulator of RpoE activity)